MATLTRKICIIGDFAVGKTSTVARFVNDVFSDKYLTTVGVKIDTGMVELNGDTAVKFVIWDIAGTDRFSAVEFSYLRGASAYLLVVDGSRRNTLTAARALRDEVEERYGALPLVTLLNKSDLSEEWELSERDVVELEQDGFRPLLTSAKDGSNVSEAMRLLASLVV